jgi:hypothetical protein
MAKGIMVISVCKEGNMGVRKYGGVKSKTHRQTREMWLEDKMRELGYFVFN